MRIVWASAGIVLAAAAALAIAWLRSADARALHAAEANYADLIDARGALGAIESGAMSTFAGFDRAAWRAKEARSLAALRGALAGVSEERLSARRRRALAEMRSAFDTGTSLAPTGDCGDAARPDASGRELRIALYACFSAVGDAIEFEGRRYARVAALQLLEQLEEPARRRALFLAMAPLWRAVNADNRPTSPYRRLLRAEAAQARDTIAAAEASLGLARGEGRRWLEQALQAWSVADHETRIEPWDFRYENARAARVLEACAQRDKLQRAVSRYYDDLGANLAQLQVMEDVGMRPGMSPVDYTDIARIGRRVGGAWRPAIPRVSVILQSGGIAAANELAHEYGHAVHFAAIRTRPALALTSDMSLAVEAFADITSWSVYSPAWQRKYLGCAASAADGMRGRLGFMILDLAWGLFESRMAEDPSLDPNQVWTEITSRYLDIAPHPELSWWAVRGQLVDDPGYMINYALGAFVTADAREAIRRRIGDYDTGNPRWYAYVSRRLFRRGGELEPRELLRRFLGRPVSQRALIADIEEMHRASTASRR